MGLLFTNGSRPFEKTGFRENGILEKYNHFLQETPLFSVLKTFTFSNACAIQIKLGTNEFLKKTVLNIMGY